MRVRRHDQVRVAAKSLRAVTEIKFIRLKNAPVFPHISTLISSNFGVGKMRCSLAGDSCLRGADLSDFCVNHAAPRPIVHRASAWHHELPLTCCSITDRNDASQHQLSASPRKGLSEPLRGREDGTVESFHETVTAYEFGT